MDIDEYFKEVEEAVDYCLKSSINNQEYVKYLIGNCPSKTLQIITIRKDLLSKSDYDNLSAYLEIGWFADFQSPERIALFSFMFDIGRSLALKSAKNRFKLYDKDQAVFSKDPALFECIRTRGNGSKDLELINASCVANIQGTEVFQRNQAYYKLDPLLNPAIFTWATSQFHDAPVYIRLDPRFSFSECPQFQLNEEILIPANPNWWRELSIHRRNTEGSSYFLESKPPSRDNTLDYWEYNVCGIRRLDVVAKRTNDGNLSMMVEELSEKESSSGITIGRCIHLDTDDEVGTDFSNSILNHLDLAINAYEYDARDRRHKDNLAHGGMVEDASFRTHLFRIEKVPLKSLLVFASMFFESKILLSDWFKDQFTKSSNA